MYSQIYKLYIYINTVINRQKKAATLCNSRMTCSEIDGDRSKEREGERKERKGTDKTRERKER